MTEDRSIYDLLERAVRDHLPAAAEPVRAVIARAGMQRRRAAITAAAAGLVLVVGAVGLVTVVDRSSRGAGPVAGPGQPPVARESGPPPVSPGRAEADARAASAAAEAAAAAERAAFSVDLGHGVVAVLPNTPIVATPPGWIDFPGPAADGQLSRGGLACPLRTNVVYRVTIRTSEGGGTDAPCEGQLLPPYVWEYPGVPRARSGDVRQRLLDNGTLLWSQTSGGFDSGKTPAPLDLYVPAVGQSVVAVAVSEADVLALIQPTQLSAFRAPQAQPQLSARVAWTGSRRSPQTVPAEELPALLAELAATASGPTQPCRTDDGQYEVEFSVAGVPYLVVVVDSSSGCTTAVSSLGGGSARVSPGLVPLLVGLSLPH